MSLDDCSSEKRKRMRWSLDGKACTWTSGWERRRVNSLKVGAAGTEEADAPVDDVVDEVV